MMATIVFQAVGAAIGSAFGPIGTIVGRAAGALVGSAVDRAIFSDSRTMSGARLATARIPGASEGTAINRVYGSARIGGTLIWATRFEEEVTTERSGGKSTGGAKVRSFHYYGNMAVGLCEGPVAGIRRAWFDGREVDLTGIELRFHDGSENQQPDPLIEAKQGAGKAPAYRGLAYVVIEHLPLGDFGNRIPVMQFEVMRPVGTLERQARAMVVIPGATEHGYATTPVSEKTGAGSIRILNRNGLMAATDWQASIDELQAVCPNLETVALVVTWFGTDLRAGNCRIVPGVEVAARQGESRAWSVAGIGRAGAHLISHHQGGPAFGGTPDDASVVEAIRDLKARGLKVVLYPFLMMDIAYGNDLTDPYGEAAQPAYPWRGRVTCHPAIGQPATADRSAAARSQINAFCGSAKTDDFVINGTRVRYDGPDEGYRRLVLHYALLAKAAGGIDGFLLGSELRGLTTVRDAANAFPFVEQLIDLAGDVRAILGAGTSLTYGADWSEYFGYHPQDGSGDVFFHLDPLWASSAIDAVGIDNYMPLADWRDEDRASASPDGFRVGDDPVGLEGQITGGEGFDWYYASGADRESRNRSQIADGLAGKPWVFRYKDIENWWGNRHYEREGGVEKPSPTAWTAGMKPVWLTELGCPAVDKGSNQPNVFADPKSSESAMPYFSGGGRSDSTQRRFLEAHHRHWQSGDAPDGMVDPERLFLWCWDARPYPAFPFRSDIWNDGGNWRTGHWLNARLGAGTLADVIAAILTDHGFTDFDVSQVSGDLTGYMQGQVTSARALIEPLVEVFALDVIEDGGRLVFRSRDKASLPAADVAVLADLKDEPLWRETRGHDGDFAAEAVLTFFDEASDYGEASARSRRLEVATRRELTRELAAVIPEETALLAAEGLLRDHRLSRHTLEYALSPNRLDVTPGDVLRLTQGPGTRFIVTRIEDGAARRLHLRRLGTGSSANVVPTDEGRLPGGNPSAGFAPLVHLMDLPRLDGAGTEADFARVAALAKPWRRIALSSSPVEDGYRLRTVVERPAVTGTLMADLGTGVSGRFDRSQSLDVGLDFGALSSAPRLSVLNGTNRMAVQSENGGWEVLAFAQAEEIATGRWRLSNLLRGLAGTEDCMTAGAVSGASVVLLNEAVVPVGLAPDEAGLLLNWIAEPATGSGAATEAIAFAGGLRAATPLAPVHLQARRQSDGDIRITWVRRGRLDADDWMAADIPLDEEEEGYRLDLLDGEAVVRSVHVSQPAYVYAQSDEIADFGAVPTTRSVRVRQLGRKVAEGLPAEADLPV